MTMDEQALTKEIRTLTVSAKSVTVQCDVDYEMAGVMLKGFKEKEAQVREFFKPLVATAHAAHKALTTRLNEAVAPLSEAKKAIGSEMGRYTAKLEAERLAEEEKLRAQLQKEADEKAIETATNLEAEGEREAADEVLENVPIVRTTLESVAPKVEGTVRRTTWHYEIIEEALIPRSWWCVDHQKISDFVRRKKGDASIPGVSVFSTTNVS